MAASGSVIGDLIPERHKAKNNRVVWLSQVFTLFIGLVAILLASAMENVLSLMLYAYAFMVSGLFVPVVAAMLLKVRYPQAALASMITGGGVTTTLIVSGIVLPLGLDANIYGLTAAVTVYLATHQIMRRSGQLAIDGS